MEVPGDHRAAESVGRSSVVGARMSARFAMLAAVSVIGGDERIGPATHDAAVSVAPADPSRRIVAIESLDGRSLIGPTFAVESGVSGPLSVRIERTRETLRLAVDGKEYDVRHHPSAPDVAIGPAIDDVALRSRIVDVLSDEFGRAEVEQREVERVLSVLAASDETTVRVTVEARYVPKGGTALAAVVALGRLWRGRDGSEPECFTIEFDRTNAGTRMLAAH